jgi:hypothetical protein
MTTLKLLAAAALLLSLTSCAEMAARRAADAAERNAELSRIQDRYYNDPEFRARYDRAKYAQEYCANQAAYTNATTRGLLQSAFAGIEVQASCIDFYKRTGHLPGQAF